jgi:V/A-type H+-transporting ATPase subunit F
MYKIAVIGGADSVIGFRALGLDTYPVASCEEARKTLHAITRPREDEYAIIYIEETMAAEIQSEIRKYDERPSPAIILIPGRNGPIGIGRAALDEAIEKAIGADIL